MIDAGGTATGGRTAAIWVVTDGRPGNEKPAWALAEAVAAATGAAVVAKRIAFQRGADWIPPRAWAWAAAAGGAAADRLLLSALASEADAVAPPWPLLAIGAGRRSGPVVSALRRRGALGAQILNPHMGSAAFDLVVAPAHDGLSGPGVCATVGSLHDVTPAALAAEPPDPRLPAARPLIGVLIGGASRSARFEDADVDRLIAALEDASPAAIAATASRRTPAAAARRLRAAVAAWGGFFWDGAGANPYRAILAQSDALIVTADSVNMASEAAGAGKPVFIAPLSGLSPKLQRFQQSLADTGASQPLPGRLTAAMLTSAVEAASFRAPLDDRAAPAARLAALLRPQMAGAAERSDDHEANAGGG